MAKIKIRVKRPYIGFPGSSTQNTYAEDLNHYYFQWDIKSKNDFTVTPKELPNPKPFITIAWDGSVEKTVKQLKPFKPGSRVRIKSDSRIPLKYSSKLVSIIKDELKASEIIFKDDHKADVKHVNAGATKLLKSDLRNPDVLLKLLQEHYKTTELHVDEWRKIYDNLKRYVNLLVEEETPRNVKWSLKNMKFDNLFNYGEGNVINFENMNGLVGLFAPNRSGKSSVLGTLIYTLFNGTDRGSLKNLLVCNSRKQECSSKITLNLAGKDYVVERRTEKRSNKQGVEHGVTDLLLWEMEDDKLKEITGEQRPDTEKILKRLIGTADDFHMMSITTQTPGLSLLEQGSTKRRHILSRFLDIDVLQQIHELAHTDVKEYKSVIKSMSDLDWNEVIRAKRNEISIIENSIEQNVQTLEVSRDELIELKTKLTTFGDVKTVSLLDVQNQESIVESIINKLNATNDKQVQIQKNILDTDEKLSRLNGILETHDLPSMKQSMETFKVTRSSINNMLQLFQIEERSLEKNKRSLKILEEVPCGDDYPTCKFIKDAHETKSLIEFQEQKVRELKKEYDKARTSLNVENERKLTENINKLEQLKEKHHQLRLSRSKLDVEIEKTLAEKTSLEIKLSNSQKKLDELRSQTDESKHSEISAIKSMVLALELKISQVEKENLLLATKRGKIESELDKVISDQQKRADVLQKMKIYEVIETSFSKNGIQDVLLSSLLPAINDEIAKILTGIVSFTVELIKDPENDQIDIYINYGDEKRILELASGMEKMLSSIAIKVALNQISSLPKSDIFIIDEGFGTLDQEGLTACSLLLQSLKNYFKTVLIITHVDQIKETVDTFLDISKNGKDSQIIYS